MRTAVLLAAAALSSACFGKLSVAVSHDVQPAVIAPGGSVQQEVRIDADGFLGAAIRESMTQRPSAAADVRAQGWELRDTSEGTNVHLRLARSVAVGSADLTRATERGGFDIGRVELAVDDWVLVRRYRATVRVAPANTDALAAEASGAGGIPAGQADALGRQLADALLAGITYDQSLTLPGILTSTNGVRGEGGKVVWHMQLRSTSEQALVAESVYPDLPRIGLVLAALALLALGLIVRGRASTPPPPTIAA